MSIAAPDFQRRGPGDFARGFVLPFRAASAVFRSPRLLALSALAALVTLVTLSVVLVGVWNIAPALVERMWERPDAWYLVWLWYLLVAISFAVLTVIGAATLPVLALAPIEDPISEATESLCGGFASPPLSLGGFLRSAGRSIGHTVARVFLLLAGHAVLFALNLLPGVGQAAWSVLGTTWTMFWLAGEYLSAPMARNGFPFRDVRRVLWRRLPLCMGFGAAVWLLLWVPVLNLLFVPLAVIAGTLLYRGLRSSGDLAVPPVGH